MELDSDLEGDDYFNGLNNLPNRKQLIQATLHVNKDELKFFRRLHVLLQALEQPAEQEPMPEMWVASYPVSFHDISLT